MLYLDHCATTPLRPEVITAVTECMAKYYGNPSSLHRLGVEAESLLIRAREVAAGALKVKPEELYFTSGGTESNNTAIKGAALAYSGRGRHLITSAIEHASVYEAFRQLEQQGFEVTYLPVDETGAVRPEDLASAIRKDTVLVSLMAVNNETGRIQPVAACGRLLRDHPRILFHVDAVQTLGKVPASPGLWHADLASYSAHKLGGPKGVGLLYKREGVNLVPLLAGGGQEKGLRSGTENVPLIVGAAKAIRMAAEEQSHASKHMYACRARLLQRLAAIEGIQVHGAPDMQDMAPHVVQFSCPGFRPEALIHLLEERDIYISSRSACSSGEQKPSRVLMAMGTGEAAAASGLRVSYSGQHTEADMDVFADELEKALRIAVKQGARTGGERR